MIYSINEYWQHRGTAWQSERDKAITNLNQNIEDSEYFNWKILIPKKYARMESNKRLHPNEVEAVEHYTIYITKQIGTVHNRRNTFLYCKFPTSDQLFTIILHMDGGVSYEKREHKHMIRVTDELDRRIVLGFCKMYQDMLMSYCYINSDKPEQWILNNAATYTADQMSKRLKTGSDGNYYKYPDLKPYEENGIFSNVALI